MPVNKRTRARELVMQALYQLDVQGPDLLTFIDEFFLRTESDELIRKQASTWTKQAWENLAQCDKLIAESTIKWQFGRLSAVDKSILRLSVYQLKFCPEIPPKVVINEAIELAKKFSSDKAPSFVNGVLDTVMKRLIGQK